KDFALITGGIVSGKITEQKTGKPVDGVVVGVIGSGLHQSMPTNSDGTYLMHIPPGKHMVQILGDLPAGFEEPKKNMVPITVTQDQAITTDFQLPGSPPPIIKGKTVDAQGNPLAGVTVFAQSKSYEYEGNEPKTVSDAAGSFSLKAVAGSTIHAHKDQLSITQ